MMDGLKSLTKNATKSPVKLYAYTVRPFCRSGLDFGLSWGLLEAANPRISRLAASLRPGQPKISARQPKKSCCLCIQCNKRPFTYILLIGQTYHSNLRKIFFFRVLTKIVCPICQKLLLEFKHFIGLLSFKLNLSKIYA